MICEKCRSPLRPIVALDVDGTLADYHGHFIEFALKWMRVYSSWDKVQAVIRQFNESQDLADALNVDKATYRTIKLAYRQGGQKRFQPTMGPVASLFKALHVLGCDIWITTTRPYNRFDSTDPDTREWLEHHTWGQKWQGLIYDDNKYEVLCDIVGADRVVLVVDDLRANCTAAHRLGLQTVQFVNKYNCEARWSGLTTDSFPGIIEWAEKGAKHHEH